jgi:drug/metabolite transporter (DMT)-like permease
MAVGRAGGLGLAMAVFSAATFATSGSFASSLMASGWTPGGAVTLRVGVAALVLTVPALIQLRGRWSLLWRCAPAVVAYGAVAVAGGQLFYFNAVQHLSVSVALLLEYSGTILVVLWLWLRHGQRPRQLTLAGGAVTIVGLVLVLDLTGRQRADLVGVLWGFAAAVGLAMYFVLSSHTDDQLPPIALAWAGMVVGAAVLAGFDATGLIGFRVNGADVDFAGHVTTWLVPALGLCLVAAVVAYTAGIGAARRLGAKIATFVGLTEVLFAGLWAWLLLGQRPSPLQVGGGVVVLVGIALVRADEPAATEPALPELAPEQESDPEPVAVAVVGRDG